MINYALGILTGLVMEFQFGLNWNGLSHYAGVLGLLAIVDYVLIIRAVRRRPVAVALGADDPAGGAEHAHALGY